MSTITGAYSSDVTNNSVPRKVTSLSIFSRKRWCLACIVIYCARAFKNVLTKKNRISSPGCSTDRFVIEIDPSSDLTKLVREKNLEKLVELGGVQCIASSLNSDVHDGINCGDPEDILPRIHQTFGGKTHHDPPRKCFKDFSLEAFADPPTAFLLACGTLALGFGIKQHGVKEGWYDGGSIFVAVLLVTSFSAITNFRKSRLLPGKHSQLVNSSTQTEVVRNGRRQQIPIFQTVVGDVVCLKIGDRVPADGIFVDGDSLCCVVHVSSMSGESDHVEINNHQNPFLFSGSMVLDGCARMLVTSVGINTTWRETMATTTLDSAAEVVALEDQLTKLSLAMRLIGSILALITVVFCYLTCKKVHKSGNNKPSSFPALVEFIATVVNSAILSIPGGLPVVFTHTISYSLRKITAKAIVQKISACESMKSVTTICTGRYGILPQSEMRVMKFWLGKEFIGEGTAIVPIVLDLLHQAVSLNEYSTSVQWEKEVFSITLIEEAILSWALSKHNLMISQVKQSCSILQAKEFNSEDKRSGVLIKKNEDNTIHVHWKGAAEMILEMCSHYYNQDGDVRVLEDSDKQEFHEFIQGMASSRLRCIAFAHKQILDFNYDDGEIEQEIPENCLILLGIVGLKDPCKEAVRDCQDAGVNIKMITGEDISKAKAIAVACGILGSDHNLNDGSVVEGVEFRNFTEAERMERVDEVVVLAKSSALDNYLLLKCLKEKGHVIAVTGDGENDAMTALKKVDIRLLMGIQAPEVSKISADTLILDGDFTAVIRVLRWGRCTYSNIQKFTQLQLTAYISGLVITIIMTFFVRRVPMTAAEALWVNLIINPLGALALATEKPTKEQMEKPVPTGKASPLITNFMWRNLLGQALYQIVVIMLLQLRGESIFGITEKVNDTLVYNTFVLCQVFNQFNVRRLERKNIFEGISRNKLFLVIVGITITLHVMMMELLKDFAGKTTLEYWGNWAACIGISVGCWVIDFLIKFMAILEKSFAV